MVYNPFTGWPVTGTWLEHLSYSDGGTDYPLGYNSDLPAPAAGTLQNHGMVGSAGRRATLWLDTPVARQIAAETREGAGPMVGIVFQHAASYNAERHYTAGEIIGKSGASANGSDHGGDVHLHIHGVNAAGQRVDFTKFIDGITTNPPQEEEEEDMAGTLIKNTSTAGVYWQEKPFAPLYPLTAGLFAAWQNQGSKLATLSNADFDAVYMRVGAYVLDAQGRRRYAQTTDIQYDGWVVSVPA